MCLHRHAQQVTEDWEQRRVTYAHPETRKAENQCRDFRRHPWWEKGILFEVVVLVAVSVLIMALVVMSR